MLRYGFRRTRAAHLGSKEHPMNIAIFGATGKSGRHLVEQALAAGHAVTAHARDPSRIATQHERLKVVRGDVQTGAGVEDAIKGSDAVLSALGHTRGSAKDVHAVGTSHILRAMQSHGVRRLVSLTGAGVRDERDPPYWGAALPRLLLNLIAPGVLPDAEAHARLIRASDRDFVIVRAPRLTDGARTGVYRVGYLKLGLGASISRADVADFMLKQLTDDTYLRQAPMVSY